MGFSQGEVVLLGVDVMLCWFFITTGACMLTCPHTLSLPQVREELSFAITQPILFPERFEALGMATAAVSACLCHAL